jgi:hypothetical protein
MGMTPEGYDEDRRRRRRREEREREREREREKHRERDRDREKDRRPASDGSDGRRDSRRNSGMFMDTTPRSSWWKRLTRG